MSDTPRLRNVEAFPVEHEGRRLVALRDPAGYTTAVLMLPAPLVEIVALFDGEHTILDIQAELTRRHGEIVPSADIEHVVQTLDEHGFMHTERFAALRDRIDGEFLAAPSRPASHAGGAYPREPEALRRTMDGFFSDAKGPGPIDGASAT